MRILDMRTGETNSGKIVGLGWNFTMREERVIVTLDTGFQVEIFICELDKIRPLGKKGANNAR